jgi:hypothetical protein
MHTMVRLDNGLLTVSIVSEESCDVSRRRWSQAVRPGIAFLRSLGGGGLVIPHRRQDIAA